VGNIDLKMVYAIENSNKFQKMRFWKEKLVEDVLTLGPMAQDTLINIKKELGLSTSSTYFDENDDSTLAMSHTSNLSLTRTHDLFIDISTSNLSFNKDMASLLNFYNNQFFFYGLCKDNLL
jgi:hypothetical protein